ncbi:ABC transporter ATP-binding protein [Parafrankia sp. EUN1f]|uniref:ABC transporter ATP-binding protein n=1 Tax=Parafrankia sp. EUN1f TaxID=102897 RepID=UPI0001C45B4F|nr:ABC transporter ATP-binding protein [Parafrankia sp. EUN1f]EFC81724.1 ABC transporter related protein [Parafrankia sp. EUN1f]
MTIRAWAARALAARAARGGPGLPLIVAAVGRHRRLLAAGIGAGLVWTGTKLAAPPLVTWTIDAGVLGGDTSRLWLGVMLFAGLAVVGAGFAGLRRYYGQCLAFVVEADLRDRLLARVVRLPAAFHDRHPGGVLVARATTDLQQAQQPVINIAIMVSNLVMLVGAAVLLASIDPVLAAIALAPAVAVFAVAVRFTRRLGPRALDLQTRLGRLASTVEESIAGVRTTKGLGTENDERRRIHERAGEVQRAALRLNTVRATYQPLIELLPAFGLVGVLWIGGLRVAHGSLTVGELVQFSYFGLVIVGPLRIAGMTASQLKRAVVSAGLVAAVLDERQEASPRQPAATAAARSTATGPAGGGLTRSTGRAAGGLEVRFEGVTFGYGPGRPVLRDLDLVVRAGECVAVVGATGSGKTTLGALVPRFYEVDAGRILVGGRDVRQWPLAELRAQLGVGFEDAFLFSGTVRDNLRFGAPEADDTRLRVAVRLAGAQDVVAGRPGGYDAAVGERGLDLSGGQRQRLSLARALVADPPVLLLDSPTSAVDPAKEAEIVASLAAVIQGRTTLIVAHQPAVIALADRVVLLDGGRVADLGTHDDLLARSPRYRQVLAAHPGGTHPGGAGAHPGGAHPGDADRAVSVTP